MSDVERTCRHFPLVASRACRVEQCSHGTVHLVLGDITLRLSAEAFLELARALGSAATRMEEPRVLC